MDKLSYSWGLLMGSQLKGMGVKELDSADFKDGVTAAFNGEEPRISRKPRNSPARPGRNSLPRTAARRM